MLKEKKKKKKKKKRSKNIKQAKKCEMKTNQRTYKENNFSPPQPNVRLKNL